mgnify:CR=1 FL=1
MDVLSFPLKFNNRGEFIKVSDTSEDYKAQQIKAFISTHKGERRVFPTFGISDPTFEDFQPLEMIDAIGQFYGSTLSIANVQVIKTQGAIETIEVNFGS